jgi:uncharacterized protein
VDAILQVLGGQAQQVHRERRRDNFSTLLLMIFFAFILLRVLAATLGSRSGSRLFWLWVLLGGLRGNSRGGGFGGGGFGGGGGFSGGGGSFGGGGASGSW